jgi:hypothetical protein
MGFQLRIVLALIVVLPFIRNIQQNWDRLLPAAYFWIAIAVVIPIVLLIFLVNLKTLLWTVTLIAVTIAGGAVGFFSSSLIFPGVQTGDHVLASVIPALLSWILAVRLKHRLARVKFSRSPSKG